MTSRFDVRFTVEGVLRIDADSADAAEAAAIDILESGHLDDADDREIDRGTAQVVSELRDDNDCARAFLRAARVVEFAS